MVKASFVYVRVFIIKKRKKINIETQNLHLIEVLCKDVLHLKKRKSTKIKGNEDSLKVTIGDQILENFSPIFLWI